MKRTGTFSNILGGWTICARMATQILAAESNQARIHRPATRLTSIVRKGGADARLACARRRHSCLHALPRDSLRQCGRLGVGGSLHDCGGRRDVLDEDRRRRCGSRVNRTLFRVLEWGGIEVE